MRVVVTGAAGFLGSHLCERLLSEGHSVLGIDNLLTGQRRNVELLEAHAGFQFRQADASEPWTVGGPVDRIFHLASPASPIDEVEHPFQTMCVNAEGSRYGLELAEREGARFFLASTSEAYSDPAVPPQV